MTPAVTLVHPKKPLASRYPFHIASCQPLRVPIDLAPGNIYPGWISFCQNYPHLSSRNITQHDSIGILFAVELLDDHFLGICCPFHPWQVMIARIARYFKPARGTTSGADYPYARGGVHFACLRIRKNSSLGIEIRRVVN